MRTVDYLQGALTGIWNLPFWLAAVSSLEATAMETLETVPLAVPDARAVFSGDHRRRATVRGLFSHPSGKPDRIVLPQHPHVLFLWLLSLSGSGGWEASVGSRQALWCCWNCRSSERVL